MNRKDVCPCCGHALPPYRVRVAYGGLPDCPHCGSNCGLPPIPLLSEDHVEAKNTRRWLIFSLLLWLTGVGAALWGALGWTGP